MKHLAYKPCKLLLLLPFYFLFYFSFLGLYRIVKLSFSQVPIDSLAVRFSYACVLKSKCFRCATDLFPFLPCFLFLSCLPGMRYGLSFSGYFFLSSFGISLFVFLAAIFQRRKQTVWRGRGIGWELSGATILYHHYIIFLFCKCVIFLSMFLVMMIFIFAFCIFTLLLFFFFILSFYCS